VRGIPASSVKTEEYPPYSLHLPAKAQVFRKPTHPPLGGGRQAARGAPDRPPSLTFSSLPGQPVVLYVTPIFPRSLIVMPRGSCLLQLGTRDGPPSRRAGKQKRPGCAGKQSYGTMKTLTNSETCTESRIRISLRIPISVIGRFSPEITSHWMEEKST
jgi:hypothetical protein